MHRKIIFFTLVIILSICISISFIDYAEGVVSKIRVMRDADAQHTSQEPDPDYETEKEQPEYVKGEVLVKFREGADPQEVIYYTALSGASVERIHTIEPITKKFLKDYKLEKDSDGWYWFLGKNYKEIEEIPEEEAFQQAYQNMSPAKKSLYRWHKIALPVGMSVEEAITELEDNPDIEYAEPNYISRVFYVPNDPMYSQQWAHQKTQAEAAWDMERGNPDVVIAIIDTGVAYNHQDLAANIWRDSQNNPGRDFVDINFAEYDPARYQLLPGEDYTDIDDDPSDYHGHGSHCAGITAAVGSNSIGVAGACHNCSIMPVRAGFSILYWNQDFEIWQEVGQFENDDIFLAIAYAADSGADVISMSFGGGGYSSAEKNVIDYAYSEGLVLIAATGNADTDEEHYPAAYDNVIAIAATAADDTKAYYSNYGGWIDVSAPGGDYYKDSMILSTVPAGYDSYQGTSMACPYVAGLAALIMSYNPNDRWTQDPDDGLTNEIVRSLIEESTDNIDALNPGYEGRLGTGRINAQRALIIAGIDIDAAMDDDSNGSSSGNDNGVIEPGETIELTLTLTNENNSAVPVTNINGALTLESPDPYVTIQTGSSSITITSFDSLEELTLGPFVFTVSSAKALFESIDFNLTVNMSGADMSFALTKSLHYTTNLKIEIERITTDSSDQQAPDIYEDKIVWHDNRNGNWDVYMHDLSLPEGSREERITTDSSDQQKPAIFEDKVAWQDYRVTWDVYMCDLSVGINAIPIATGGYDQISPDIYKEADDYKIVWEDRHAVSDSSICMYDSSDSSTTEISADTPRYTPVSPEHPAIYGDKVVWHDDASLLIYDNSVSPATLHNVDASLETPAIYADGSREYKVAGQKSRDTYQDIYMYAFSNDPSWGVLTPIASDDESQLEPAVYGNRIAWYRDIDGSGDIYMYDLILERMIQVTADDSSQISPAIYGDRIVWQDSRNGNWDIYMATVSYGEAPFANFAAHPISGNQPLTVQFIGKAVGTVDSWAWNFGDPHCDPAENTSTKQNPTHTYTELGNYTVSLTVSGPGVTDAKTKTDYISVVSIIVDFTALPRSGNAPFDVQFTDTSSTTGDTITSWLWDFGDENTSTGQNPTHTYNTPGIYTVALTVTGSKARDTKTEIDFIDVNGVPVANDQSVSLDEDGEIIITLTGDDIENDPLELTYHIIPGTGPSHGSLGDIVGNQVTYTPDSDYNGDDSFDFKVIDDKGAESNAATVSITIEPVNDAPTATGQSVTTDEDTSKEITLVGDDIENDPLELTYHIIPGTGPSHGSLGDIVGNQVTYIPDSDYNGADSFTFVANDGTTDSNTATVSITINSANDVPVANDKPVTTDEDNPIAIILEATDIDGDNSLTYSIVTAPGHGSTSSVDGNQVTYTPHTNYYGSDSFTFKANDGTADSNIATVSITINPVNDAPVADDQPQHTTDEDVPKDITLTATDVDGDTSTYSIVTDPENGTLTGTTFNLVYTPDPDYNGADTFTFIANDGEFDSNVATVSITIIPVNDAPVLNPIGNKHVDEGGVLSFLVSATDPEEDAFDITAGELESWMGFTFEDGTFTFTASPDSGDAGNYIITFEVSEVSDGSLTDTETIYISVGDVNRPPTADSDSVSLNEDASVAITLEAADADIDGDPLTYSIVTAPAHGNLTGAAPDLTYTPDSNYNGADSFTFKVNDGELDSIEATISITVNAVNDAPVAYGKSVTTDEDTSVAITLEGTDIDGHSLAYSIVTAPAHGNLTGAAPDLTYTPDSNYNGADSFTFKVNDGELDSIEATISITVNAAYVALTVSFTVSPVSGDVPLEAQFTDASSVTGDAITSWLWNFGDGTTSTSQNPIHTYQDAGTYTVVLTLTTVTGESDTGTETNCITVNSVTTDEQSGTTDDDDDGASRSSSGYLPYLLPADSGSADESKKPADTSSSASSTQDYDDSGTEGTGTTAGTSEESDSSSPVPDEEVYPEEEMGRIKYGERKFVDTKPTRARRKGKDTTYSPIFSQVEDEFIEIEKELSANRYPVLAPIGNKTIDAGGKLTITLSAADPDGDVLKFSVDSLPQGASFEGDVFTWIPGYKQAGDYEVGFRVNDGKFEDTETIFITVNKARLLSKALSYLKNIKDILLSWLSKLFG